MSEILDQLKAKKETLKMMRRVNDMLHEQLYISTWCYKKAKRKLDNDIAELSIRIFNRENANDLLRVKLRQYENS